MSKQIPDGVPEEVRKRLQSVLSLPKTPWDVLVWAEGKLWELHEHEPELGRLAEDRCKRFILSGITKGIEGTRTESAITRSLLSDSVTEKLANLARDVAIGVCPPHVIREVQRTTTHKTFGSARGGLNLLRDWALAEWTAAASNAPDNGTATGDDGDGAPPKMSHEQAEAKARQLYADQGEPFLHKTEVQWSQEIGCSARLAGKLPLRRTAMEITGKGRARRDKGANPAPTRVVSLSPAVEAQAGERDKALERLMAEQKADDTDTIQKKL